MSMPDRMRIPLRNITRRSVRTKWVVFHESSGRAKYQMKPSAHIRPTMMPSTVFGVCPSDDPTMTPARTPPPR